MNGKKGGVKSGEKRREKKELKEKLDILLNSPLKGQTREELLEMGFKESELDEGYGLAILLGQMQKAVFDPQAAKMIWSWHGNDTTETIIKKEENNLKRENFEFSRKLAQEKFEFEKEMRLKEFELKQKALEKGIVNKEDLPQFMEDLTD